MGGVLQPRNGRNYNAQPLLSLRLYFSFHSSARRKKKIKKIYETAKRKKKLEKWNIHHYTVSFFGWVPFLTKVFFFIESSEYTQ